MLTVEYAVYAFMRKLANRYTGGYWGYLNPPTAGSNGAGAGDHPSTFAWIVRLKAR